MPRPLCPPSPAGISHEEYDEILHAVAGCLEGESPRTLYLLENLSRWWLTADGSTERFDTAHRPELVEGLADICW